MEELIASNCSLDGGAVSNNFEPVVPNAGGGGIPFAGQDCLSETTYESNLPYALRFMIDCEIGGMTWIKVEKNNW